MGFSEAKPQIQPNQSDMTLSIQPISKWHVKTLTQHCYVELANKELTRNSYF